MNRACKRFVSTTGNVSKFLEHGLKAVVEGS